MALIDDVEALVDVQQRLALSRYRAPTSTTEDTVWTAAVAVAAAGEFRTRTGVAYDSTAPEHVSAGVSLWLYLAYRWTHGVTPQATQLREEAENSCERVRVTVGAQARLAPRTSSLLTPSAEVAAGETKRPAFDAEVFERTTLNPPVRGV